MNCTACKLNTSHFRPPFQSLHPSERAETSHNYGTMFTNPRYTIYNRTKLPDNFTMISENALVLQSFKYQFKCASYWRWRVSKDQWGV